MSDDSRKLPDSTAEEAIARVSLARGGTHVGNPPPIPVTVQPTQLRRPWRATIRTAFQVTIGLATLLPFVVSGIYATSDDYPAVVVQALGVSTAISRVMALPQVEQFLRRFLPWLAAAPR